MSPDSLEALQKALQQAVLSGRPDPVLEHTTPSSRADRQTRLGVYLQAYRLRLEEVLQGDYPKLHAYIGDREFSALCGAYLERHPSRHYSVRWFGRNLPRLLGEQSPWSGLPQLAELARFEWTLGEVFDAPDAGLVTEQELMALAPEAWPDLRLRLHPSLRRLELEWNVVAIWQALERGEEPPEAARAGFPVSWVLWRRDLKNWFQSLPVEAAWALDRFAEGADFATVCEGLTEWIDPVHVPLRAASLLKEWVGMGLVSGIE
ncbi:MAG: DUF2063 domain-containing protein [Gammaproteobacteria bacterium]|nr:MAG: DUF2063 domain-containing protein [Gammaproteobacteria bacterium]